VTPAHLALVRLSNHIVERLEKLEPQLDGGDPEVWREYLHLGTVLAAIAPQTVPGVDGGLLSTSEMASRLGVSSKTLLRQKASGKITPAKILGQRGRAAFRWAAR